MYCTNCGKQFEGKFCPECGSPAAQTPSEFTPSGAPSGVDAQTFAEESKPNYSIPIQKPAAPPKKKRRGCLIAVLVFIALVVIIGIAGDDSDSDASSSSSAPSSESVSQSSSVISDVSSLSNSAESFSTDNDSYNTSASTSENEIDIDLVVSVINLSLSGSYGDNYSVEGDETGISISIWQDGLAVGAAMAKNGNKEMEEDWNYMVESLQKMSESTKDSVTELGFPDTHIMIYLLNDGNHDNILLMIQDGDVLYDCTKE